MVCFNNICYIKNNSRSYDTNDTLFFYLFNYILYFFSYAKINHLFRSNFNTSRINQSQIIYKIKKAQSISPTSNNKRIKFQTIEQKNE